MERPRGGLACCCCAYMTSHGMHDTMTVHCNKLAWACCCCCCASGSENVPGTVRVRSARPSPPLRWRVRWRGISFQRHTRARRHTLHATNDLERLLVRTRDCITLHYIALYHKRPRASPLTHAWRGRASHPSATHARAIACHDTARHDMTRQLHHDRPRAPPPPP